MINMTAEAPGQGQLPEEPKLLSIKPLNRSAPDYEPAALGLDLLDIQSYWPPEALAALERDLGNLAAERGRLPEVWDTDIIG